MIIDYRSCMLVKLYVTKREKMTNLTAFVANSVKRCQVFILNETLSLKNLLKGLVNSLKSSVHHLPPILVGLF